MHAIQTDGAVFFLSFCHCVSWRSEPKSDLSKEALGHAAINICPLVTFSKTAYGDGNKASRICHLLIAA